MIDWIDMDYAPEHCSQAQLDELDRLTARWIAAHMRRAMLLSPWPQWPRQREPFLFFRLAVRLLFRWSSNLLHLANLATIVHRLF